jgi:glycosyltransferase involved in cell wall biosynthesis
MKILMISTDRKILESDSAVRQRIVEYGKLVDELNIVIFNSSTRVASSKYQVERILGTNVTLYPTNSRNRWFYIFDAVRIGRRVIGNWKLEIGNSSNKNEILVTCQDPFETGLVGWWIAKKTGAKLHLQIHTDFLSKYFIKESFLNRVRVCLAKFLLLKADGIRVVSERIKQSLSSIDYKLSTKAIVLPIFVDIKNYENKIPAFDLHKKYPQFDFIILMTCRLEKEKNITLAIDVMREIVKNNHKVGLVIVGDGSLLKSLELKTKNLKLETNIVFEGWQKDLFSYYKTADLFLFTSNYEGYGMSLIEASASGCPILTTDVGLVGSVLKEGDIKVCKTGKKDCFVAEIKKLLKDKLPLYDMSIKARKRIEENVIKDKQEYLNKMKEGWEECLK